MKVRKERYSKQMAGEERAQHPQVPSGRAESGQEWDWNFKEGHLCPVLQVKVLKFGPVGMVLEDSLTSSGWHFR